VTGPDLARRSTADLVVLLLTGAVVLVLLGSVAFAITWRILHPDAAATGLPAEVADLLGTLVGAIVGYLAGRRAGPRHRQEPKEEVLRDEQP
jgi:membrane protein DedA with SNARE-associated domain